MSTEGQCRIVVCHRRWIFVGLVAREDGPMGPEIVIRRAKNIRRWGTKKGLGELHNGPKAETVLDDAPQPVCLHPMQIIWSGPVSLKHWEKHLGSAA